MKITRKDEIQQYSYILALLIGFLWVMGSFIPLPQMAVLYFVDGISRQLNLTDPTVASTIYAASSLVLTYLYFKSEAVWSLTLSAIGVTIFLTPIFAYYDHVFPQTPYFLPAMLCGFSICIILLLARYAKDRVTANK